MLFQNLRDIKMGIPRNIARKLDDEALFNLYYIEMGRGGSIPKIQAKLAGEGINVTTSAVWQAINRHMARHYDEPVVKEAVKNYYLAYGKNLPDEDYYQMVSKHARTCFARKQYENWIVDNPKLPDLRLQ